jgi:hypothetical protein
VVKVAILDYIEEDEDLQEVAYSFGCDLLSTDTRETNLLPSRLSSERIAGAGDGLVVARSW